MATGHSRCITLSLDINFIDPIRSQHIYLLSHGFSTILSKTNFDPRGRREHWIGNSGPVLPQAKYVIFPSLASLWICFLICLKGKPNLWLGISWSFALFCACWRTRFVVDVGSVTAQTIVASNSDPERHHLSKSNTCIISALEWPVLLHVISFDSSRARHVSFTTLDYILFRILPPVHCIPLQMKFPGLCFMELIYPRWLSNMYLHVQALCFWYEEGSTFWHWNLCITDTGLVSSYTSRV